MDTRTSRSTAKGCCWNKCRPHNSKSQPEDWALKASAGPSMRLKSQGCQRWACQQLTVDSLQIGTWGSRWADVSVSASVGVKSLRQVRWRVGNQTCLFFAFVSQILCCCKVTQQLLLKRLNVMCLHLLSASSFSPCQHLERRRNGCHAASLSQTMKKEDELVPIRCNGYDICKEFSPFD